MKLLITSSAIATGSMAASSHADCELWGSGTSQPHQPRLAERLCRTADRMDHIIVLGEIHLRRVLKSYAYYYNGIRTHRSLNKDAPVTRKIQRIGSIKSHAILGGLHHHYTRA